MEKLTAPHRCCSRVVCQLHILCDEPTERCRLGARLQHPFPCDSETDGSLPLSNVARDHVVKFQTQILKYHFS